MDNKESMLAKANQPAVEAMKLHPFYKGKIEVVPKSVSAIYPISLSGTRPEWPNPAWISATIPNGI
jgi:hypothetical protein